MIIGREKEQRELLSLQSIPRAIKRQTHFASGNGNDKWQCAQQLFKYGVK